MPSSSIPLEGKKLCCLVNTYVTCLCGEKWCSDEWQPGDDWHVSVVETGVGKCNVLNKLVLCIKTSEGKSNEFATWVLKEYVQPA
jgi:hypothetical protein